MLLKHMTDFLLGQYGKVVDEYITLGASGPRAIISISARHPFSGCATQGSTLAAAHERPLDLLWRRQSLDLAGQKSNYDITILELQSMIWLASRICTTIDDFILSPTHVVLVDQMVLG